MDRAQVIAELQTVESAAREAKLKGILSKLDSEPVSQVTPEPEPVVEEEKKPD